MSVEYKVITKAVNSKPLLTMIREVEIIFTDFAISWSSDTQRMAAIDTIDDMMAHIYEAGRITQWNVICDFRNNTVADMNAGIYHLTITYRQAHCLNTTSIEYVIKDEATELELDFEF